MGTFQSTASVLGPGVVSACKPQWLWKLDKEKLRVLSSFQSVGNCAGGGVYGASPFPTHFDVIVFSFIHVQEFLASF